LPAILNSTNDDDSTTTTTTLSELETRTLYNEDAASGYGGKLAVVSGGRQYIVQNNIIDSVAAQKVEYETSTGNFVIKEHTGSSPHWLSAFHRYSSATITGMQRPTRTYPNVMAL
jgi:hypothetical protein